MNGHLEVVFAPIPYDLPARYEKFSKKRSKKSITIKKHWQDPKVCSFTPINPAKSQELHFRGACTKHPQSKAKKAK